MSWNRTTVFSTFGSPPWAVPCVRLFKCLLRCLDAVLLFFYWCLGTQSSDHHSKVMRRSLVSSLLFIWSLRWVSVIYINNSEVPRVPWNVVDAFILHLIATKDTFKMNNGHKNRRSKKRYYNRLNQWNNSDRLIIKHLRMNNVHNTVYLIDLFGSLAAAFSFLSTRKWKSHHKKAGKESWNCSNPTLKIILYICNISHGIKKK